MIKIVKISTLHFSKAGAARIDIGDFVKFKQPGKKADEIPTTTLGDIAKRRKPGKLGYEGASFSVVAPAPTISANANLPGVISVTSIYTDGTKGYWGAPGFYSCEASENEAEGNALDLLDCAISVDGLASSVAIYGPALAAAQAATPSLVTLSGSYTVRAVTTLPAISNLTITIQGQAVLVPAGSCQGVTTVTLSGAANLISASVTGGALPAGGSFVLILSK